MSLPIVGIGPLAGLNQFPGFFSGIPANTGMADTIVQHLDLATSRSARG
jgi:hypothetical protein